MSDIAVRDVTAEDAEILVPLLEVLGYPTSASVLRERLYGLREADPSGRIIAAFDAGGRALGFATLHVTPVLHRPTPVGRITALAVDPSSQGLGIGRRLVEESERWFRDAGLGRVEVTSGLTHVPAYEFYRHLGYADQGLRFGKSLR